MTKIIFCKPTEWKWAAQPSPNQDKTLISNGFDPKAQQLNRTAAQTASGNGLRAPSIPRGSPAP